jgi:hypothetical protein
LKPDRGACLNSIDIEFPTSRYNNFLHSILPSAQAHTTTSAQLPTHYYMKY